MSETGWLAGGWRTQHEECCRLVRESPGGLRLALIGDSLIQGWGGPGRSVLAAGAAHWERFFGGRRAGNLGIAGDRVRHVQWRLAHGLLDGCAPERVLLLIGTNDLADGATPEAVAGAVLDVARELRARAPATRILVHGLLPRGAAQDPLRHAVASVNRLLAASVPALGRGFDYADAGAALCAEDGALRAECFEADGLHLSAAGYAVWGDALLPLLRPAAPAFADGAPCRLEPGWIQVERQHGWILLAVASSLALAALILGARSDWLPGSWPPALFAVWALASTTALGLATSWPRWEYRRAGYCVLPDRIEVWRGLLWRASVSVPVARVQYVDVRQGPLQRLQGIATLLIHTAGTEGAKVELAGLPPERAVELRDWLVSQAADDGV